MKITGYRTFTKKERDYLTLRHLLRKYKIPTKSIDKFLDELRGTLSTNVFNPDIPLPFCVACHNSSNHIIRLAELPENTTELFIETK